MIVVCTGCSAKFKVADEKVGPKGAKLRCSKCQTVFLVRRDEPAPPASGPAPSQAPAPPVDAPPPLPRRASTVTSIQGAEQRLPSSELGAPLDARSAFEIDLEPAPPRGAPEPDPFSPPPPEDPFAASFPEPAPPTEGPLPAPADPFGASGAAADPFAAVQAPVPPELLRAPPPAAPAPAADDDPFATSLPALGSVLSAGDLALEERTTPPPRAARPQSSAPMDDPFGALDEIGHATFDDGHPGDIPPMSHDLPGDPFGAFSTANPAPEPSPPPAPPHREAPLHLDPFAAAAVDADPLAAGPSAPGSEADAAAEATAAEPRGLARLRSAAVNAVSLLVLLVVALALLVVWRGNVPLADAVQPSALLAALTHRSRTPPPFAPRHVTSGLYERERGAPLLFVRGEIVSSAPAAVAGVRVTVELVKGGAVVARGEGQAGVVLSPEELHGAIDAAGLARASAAAAARAPAPLRPGQALPFLVALADYPADFAGVVVRVQAEAEGGR